MHSSYSKVEAWYLGITESLKSIKIVYFTTTEWSFIFILKKERPRVCWVVRYAVEVPCVWFWLWSGFDMSWRALLFFFCIRVIIQGDLLHGQMSRDSPFYFDVVNCWTTIVDVTPVNNERKL